MKTTKFYDVLNRLTSIVSSNGAVGVVSSHAYFYNSANQRTRADLGGRSSESPTYWLYTYDSLGQVVSGKKYWTDGSPVAGQQFEYGFDDIGNRKTASGGGDQWGANLRYENYTANNLNQYTSRTVPGSLDVLGAANSNATVTILADSNGIAAPFPSTRPGIYPTIRKGEYFRGEVWFNNATGAVYSALTNLGVLANDTNADIATTNSGYVLLPKTPEGFGYDADGNLTNSGLWVMTCDAENRPTTTESSTGVPSAARQREQWTYMPDGRWIQRIVSTWNGSSCSSAFTNRFVWDGQVFLATLDHTNGLVMSFLRGLDLSGTPQGAGGAGGVVAITVQTNGTHFFAHDGNGNVTALVSATNGAVTAQYDFDPFGKTLRSTGALAKANPIRFSTQYASDVTGRLKYLHREYDPSTGRWLSSDPLAEGSDLNPYGFVGNDPLSHVDDFGLEWWPKRKTDPHDPRGRTIPNPRPVPYPPQGPVDPTPNLPPRQTPGDPRGPGGAVVVCSVIWNDIFNSWEFEAGRKICDSEMASRKAGDKCCVIIYCRGQCCVSGRIDIQRIWTYLADSPCAEVQARDEGPDARDQLWPKCRERGATYARRYEPMLKL